MGDLKCVFWFYPKTQSNGGTRRFFHPSNNTLLFETPMLVTNETDFTSLLDRMEREDALEYARQQRPSTNWTVERVICVRFDVYRLTNI